MKQELKIGDCAIFSAKEYTYSPSSGDICLTVALRGRLIRDCRVWRIIEIYEGKEHGKRLLELFNSDTEEDKKIVSEDEIKIVSLEEAKLIWEAQEIFFKND